MGIFSRSSSKTKKETPAKRGIKRVDAVITGVVLGGVVASLYGVKKLQEKADTTPEENPNSSTEIAPPPQPTKKGLFRRIFHL